MDMRATTEFNNDLGEHQRSLLEDHSVGPEQADMSYIAANAVTLFHEMQGAISYDTAVIAAAQYQAAEYLAEKLDRVVRGRFQLDDHSKFLDAVEHADRCERDANVRNLREMREAKG